VRRRRCNGDADWMPMTSYANYSNGYSYHCDDVTHRAIWLVSSICWANLKSCCWNMAVVIGDGSSSSWQSDCWACERSHMACSYSTHNFPM